MIAHEQLSSRGLVLSDVEADTETQREEERQEELEEQAVEEKSAESFDKLRTSSAKSVDEQKESPPILPFALLLVLTAVLLTLGPEFVYLKDNFGQRLNTIFKFYYQAWVLFGITALYGLDYLLRNWNKGVQRIVPLVAAGWLHDHARLCLVVPLLRGQLTHD